MFNNLCSTLGSNVSITKQIGFGVIFIESYTIESSPLLPNRGFQSGFDLLLKIIMMHIIVLFLYQKVWQIGSSTRCSLFIQQVRIMGGHLL